MSLKHTARVPLVLIRYVGSFLRLSRADAARTAGRYEVLISSGRTLIFVLLTATTVKVSQKRDQDRFIKVLKKSMSLDRTTDIFNRPLLKLRRTSLHASKESTSSVCMSPSRLSSAAIYPELVILPQSPGCVVHR